MTKEVFPFGVPDISALAKHIKKEIDDNQTPSHLEVLNILARGAGFKNFQYMCIYAHITLSIDKVLENLEKIKNYFNKKSGITTIFSKLLLQNLVIHYIWERLEDYKKWCKIEINQKLNMLYSVVDVTMSCSHQIQGEYLEQSCDCSDYEILPREVSNEFTNKDFIRQTYIWGQNNVC